MPVIAALGKQRQIDLCKLGLQSKFQNSHYYTEKTCLEKTDRLTDRQRTYP